MLGVDALAFASREGTAAPNLVGSGGGLGRKDKPGLVGHYDDRDPLMPAELREDVY